MISEKILRELPKVELHRHLEGSIRPATLKEIGMAHGLAWSRTSLQELAEKVQITRPLDDLNAVLEGFAVFQEALRSYDAIKRVTIENIEDAHRDGTCVLELRFAPSFIGRDKEISNDEIIEAVLDGVGEGMELYPVQVGLIAILPRSLPLSLNRRATADIIRYRKSNHRCSSRICGFDLADDEAGTDPRDFAPLVETARAAGLGITIHSGEDTDPGHVERCLALYSPDRIGHGIKVWGCRRVVDRLRERNIMLELCPTSNWLTRSVPSLADHPLPHLYRAGVRISINSDDPHLMGIDLTHEYTVAGRYYGLETADFRRINRDSLEASFLDDDIKGYCRRNFPL
jgi:adenosine deaminase